jgi:uncharacterized protein YuzE
MKITYDKAVDAMYIKLNEKLAYRSSKKISEDVLIDYAKDGRVVGVEILTASKNTVLPLTQTSVPFELATSERVSMKMNLRYIFQVACSIS